MTRDQILVVACHEAAHAFVAWKLGVPVDEAVVVAAEIADGEHAGYVVPGARSTEHSVMISLAGGMAERRVTAAPIYEGAKTDTEHVVQYLIRLFPNSEHQINAMRLAVVALQNSADSAEAMTRLPVKMLKTTEWFSSLCQMADNTQGMLNVCWNEVQRVATYLMTHYQMSGSDLSLICGCSTAEATADAPKE